MARDPHRGPERQLPARPRETRQAIRTPRQRSLNHLGIASGAVDAESAETLGASVESQQASVRTLHAPNGRPIDCAALPSTLLWHGVPDWRELSAAVHKHIAHLSQRLATAVWTLIARVAGAKLRNKPETVSTIERSLEKGG